MICCVVKSSVKCTKKDTEDKKNGNNQAVIRVPDQRLSKLIELFNQKKENFSVIEFAEIDELQNGDSVSVRHS
ncbi:MAG: hypothetical protein KJ963_01140 [Bacteroidetes bacterium]|nr:hypothetical protein [Bacteroidota bacterium]MBU1423903.1 hypothetical protein [Bacteroidota bacterium]MBU2635683.1 hypothetical protein [Bacteroidota bacterium]